MSGLAEEVSQRWQRAADEQSAAECLAAIRHDLLCATPQTLAEVKMEAQLFCQQSAAKPLRQQLASAMERELLMAGTHYQKDTRAILELRRQRQLLEQQLQGRESDDLRGLNEQRAGLLEDVNRLELLATGLQKQLADAELRLHRLGSEAS